MLNPNRISVIITIVFIILISSPSKAQWVSQNSGISDDLVDIFFIDSLYGWAVSDYDIISTTDGGENWIKQNSPANIPIIEKIQFASKNIGFVIGKNGLFMRSINDGKDWDIIDSELTYDFIDLCFIDENLGWITGVQTTPSTRTGVILHTTNAGTTWIKQLEKSCNCLFGSTLFMAVKFLNDQMGWALGSDYADNFSATQIYFTSDGGTEWNVIGEWENWPLFELEIVSEDTLWASGAPLVLSFDGGVNWICYGLENPDFLIDASSISPLNSIKGWVVQNSSLSEEKGIYYTMDGGKNWEQEISFGESFATVITNFRGNYLWIAGTNGLIMKRHKITSLNAFKEHINSFILHQNFPNPFNNQTKISYFISRHTHVLLQVYDVLGNTISTLVNKEQNPGQYIVELSGNNLPSGIYFYQLQASESTITKKMIYMK